ncbi:uncharacterized protein LOC144948194 [Lampetra fluviatilis]
MSIEEKPQDAEYFELVGSRLCQFKECISVKTKCEKPLNKYLTPEEICEGDKFDEVDLHCLINSRQSYDELTACKGKGYVRARKQCFQSIYKKKIEAIGESVEAAVPRSLSLLGAGRMGSAVSRSLTRV